jgi:hypothetical protein
MGMGPESFVENRTTDLRFILYGALAIQDRQFLASYLLHMTDIIADVEEGTWTEFVSRIR